MSCDKPWLSSPIAHTRSLQACKSHTNYYLRYIKITRWRTVLAQRLALALPMTFSSNFDTLLKTECSWENNVDLQDSGSHNVTLPTYTRPPPSNIRPLPRVPSASSRQYPGTFSWADEMAGNSSIPPYKLAVLIDADNAQHLRISPLLWEVARYGTICVKRAYGDWTGREPHPIASDHVGALGGVPGGMVVRDV